MKKRIVIVALMIILIMISVTTVNAANASATLNLSSEEVSPGDTFTATLNISCDEGINGLEAVLSYDDTNLQLVKTEVVDTSKWVNMAGDELNFSIIHNKIDTETSVDIVQATFKVKDTATVGTTAKITMSDIKVDSDAATNSTKTIGTKETEVSIVEQGNTSETSTEKALTSIEITKTPTRTTYIAGENFDRAGMIVVAKYSDGSTKEITDYNITNGNNLTEDQTSVTISYTESGVTKTTTQKITLIKGNSNSNNSNSNTQSDKATAAIPYTGINGIFGLIVIVGIFASIFYIKYNKYKKI